MSGVRIFLTCTCLLVHCLAAPQGLASYMALCMAFGFATDGKGYFK